MKGKWHLWASIFQLVIGLLAVAAFAVLGLGGEDMTKWVITLILAAAYVVLGIVGIIDHRSQQ